MYMSKEEAAAAAIQYLKKVVNNLIVNDCENKCLNCFLLSSSVEWDKTAKYLSAYKSRI